jgi:hypothetical protein
MYNSNDVLLEEIRTLRLKLQTAEENAKQQREMKHKARQQRDKVTGRINALTAALECLQYAAYLEKGLSANLDKVLADSLVIHNAIGDE